MLLDNIYLKMLLLAYSFIRQDTASFCLLHGCRGLLAESFFGRRYTPKLTWALVMREMTVKYPSVVDFSNKLFTPSFEIQQ
jgi:hypothetical protein